MGKILKILIGLIVFAFFMITVKLAYDWLADYDYANEPEEQQTNREKAPDFTMLDREGNTLTLFDLIENGKPIVLNFWASWCPPCREEMPDFDKVYAEIGDEVQFIMLNLADGNRETIESATKFVDDHGYNFPVYFDVEFSGASAYAVRSIPTTVLIDIDGNIATTKLGAINESTLKSLIDELRN